MPETIKAYLETVQEQIRWKRARPVLIQELERHLEDQRDDFITEGIPTEEAERLAIEDMGDPVTVGTELDAVHRPKPQWGLLGLTIALALAGAVIRGVFQDGSVRPTDANRTAMMVKALASFGLGTAALLGMYFLDVSRLARYARAVYIGALILGAGMFCYSVSQAPYQFFHAARPSFYFSQFLPVVYALWLYTWRQKRWKGFFLAILGGIPLAVISTIYPSVSSLFQLLLSGFVLMLLASWQDWFGVGRRKGLCVALGIAFSIPACPFFRGYFNSFTGRLQIALHPEQDPLGRGFAGWMLEQLLNGVPPLQNQPGHFGISAVSGVRSFAGNEWSPISFGYDFLPAQMAFQWGWVPLLLLLAALTALLLWLLVKGLRQKHLLGRSVVLAAVLTLGLQTLLSAAMNLGFVLFSSSLPLVVGNLQTVADMALIGLALSVFRGESIGPEEPAEPLQPRKRLRIRFEYQ